MVRASLTTCSCFSLLLASGSLAQAPPAASAPGATPPAEAAAEAAKPAPPKPWFESLKLSGYMFGDAYLVADHHDPTIADQNGFWLRRAYLTFDATISDAWSARLRLEANSPGDFKTNAKLDPFVKDAFVAWKGREVNLLIGLSPSPTWEVVEDFWGYRSVEKTPADLYRLAGARDFGLAAKGKLAAGKVSYHAMVGNGAGDGAETNEGKKVMLAVAIRPTAAWTLELYADREDRPGSTDRTTLQGFAGWRGGKSRYGLQYVTQDRQVPGGDDQTLAVGSAFAVWDLTAKSSLLARFDRVFDVNPEAERIPYLVLDKNSELDLAIVGWDYELHKKVALVPNLTYVMYRETDGRPAPDDDLFAKLTLFVQF